MTAPIWPSLFYWIGVVACGALAVCIAGYVVLLAYFRLIYRRFSAILFRKSRRRLSIASWHSSRIMRQDGENDHYADDWVVNERPLYVSCRIGDRRLFILAGTLKGPRSSVLKGDHP